jgi:hypothetical protein
MISLAGFIEAKCLAASKPIPEFAPVIRTVFPDRSVFTTGATGLPCDLITSARVSLAIGKTFGF